MAPPTAQSELPEDVDHETARDDYLNGRGWDAGTIDDELLGYAAANCKDDLLPSCSTGDTTARRFRRPGWSASATTGTPVCDLERSMRPPVFRRGWPARVRHPAGDRPGSPADWKGNKCDKFQVTRDDVTAEDPIYGLDTVEPGEPVPITEGTAKDSDFPGLTPDASILNELKHDVKHVLANVFHGLDREERMRMFLKTDAEDREDRIEMLRNSVPRYDYETPGLESVRESSIRYRHSESAAAVASCDKYTQHVGSNPSRCGTAMPMRNPP